MEARFAYSEIAEAWRPKSQVAKSNSRPGSRMRDAAS